MENICLQYDMTFLCTNNFVILNKKCHNILFWKLNINIIITANMQELYNCYIGIVTNILRIKYKRKLKNKKSIFYEANK